MRGPVDQGVKLGQGQMGRKGMDPPTGRDSFQGLDFAYQQLHFLGVHAGDFLAVRKQRLPDNQTIDPPRL